MCWVLIVIIGGTNMKKLTPKQIALYRELNTFLKRFDPDTVQEAVFNKIMPTKRLFRCDFLCPSLKIIIEVNGGQWTNGRHTRGGVGYENDLTKLNIAQLHGFKIFQFTYEMLERREYDVFLLHLQTEQDKISNKF